MFKFLTNTFPSQHENDQVASNIPQPLSPKSRYELFLFSTISFVFSALLLQFLIILQTAILLGIFSISFTYRLFGIYFSSESAEKWPESRIFIVYGLGLLLFFGAGLLLIFLLQQTKHILWKVRLALTWLAFLMIHTLPLGLIAGIFFFDGYGIAYTWLFNSILVRLLFAFVALLIILILRPFWMGTFLKSAYSISFLSGIKNRAIFIKNTVIYPWLAGLIVLFPFAVSLHNWYWLAYLAGLGFVLLPLFGNTIPSQNSRIDKFDKKIFNQKYPLPLFLLIVIILWIANLLSKTSF